MITPGFTSQLQLTLLIEREIYILVRSWRNCLVQTGACRAQNRVSMARAAGITGHYQTLHRTLDYIARTSYQGNSGILPACGAAGMERSGVANDRY